MSGDTGAEAGQDAGTHDRRWRWLWVALAVLIAVGIVAAIRLLPFGTAILDDVHRRNAQDLGLVAHGLESWSESIGGVARSNFIRGRVSAIPADDRDLRDGWQVRTRLRHPELREYRVVYATVTGAEDTPQPPAEEGKPAPRQITGCDLLRDRVQAAEGTLPFVRSYVAGLGPQLKVIGSFPLADIWTTDMREAVPASAARLATFLEDIDPRAPVGLPADDAAAGRAIVCYGAIIPLDRLLAPPGGKRAFSSLLVAGPEGQILAQLGPEMLPMTTIQELKVRTEGDWEDLATMATAVSGREISANAVRAASGGAKANEVLADNLAPVEVTVGAQTYIAYIRPFHPPADGFPACRPAPRGEGASASAVPECLVVGLVPKAGLWRQVVSAPPGPLFALALAVAAILVLLPALRLVLLGPGDAIGRAEAAALALGIPAAASLATLAFLVVGDVAAHREAARTRADRIALEASGTVAGELSSRIKAAQAQSVSLSGQSATAMGADLIYAEKRLDAALLAERQKDRKAPATAFEALAPEQMEEPPPLPDEAFQQCIRDSIVEGWEDAPWWDIAKTPRTPPTYVSIGQLKPADPRPLRCAKSPLCRDAGMQDAAVGLPLVELVGLVDSDGRPVRNVRAIACRTFPGGRTRLSGRDYFRRLETGHVGLADLSTGADRHVVAQVMALQDGLPQTVIARSAAIPSWHRPFGAPSRDVFVVATTTLPSLVRPLLPPPFELMVVDTRDPSLPVVAHSRPGRAGAERLSAMTEGSGNLHGRLWQASVAHRAAIERSLTGEVTTDPLRFTAFYDGDQRHFAAVPIAGTTWAAIAYYPEGGVDSVPIMAGWRTLLSWAATSILFGGAWLGWLLLVGQRGVGGLPARPSVSDRIRHALALGPTGWPRLWPQEGHGGHYLTFRTAFLLLAGGALATLLLGLATGLAPVLLLATGLAVRLAAAVSLHIGLAAPTVTSRALSPATQRRYVSLALALIACLSIVPMLGLWNDARALQLHKVEAELVGTATGPGGALDLQRRAFADLRWVLGLQDLPAPATRTLPGQFGFEWTPDEEPVANAADSSFAGALLKVQTGETAVRPPQCGTRDRSSAPMFCGADADGIGWQAPGLLRTALEPQMYMLLALFAAGLLTLIWFAVTRTLRALCGFGIALEAATYPRLNLGNLWERSGDPARQVGPDGRPVELQTLNRKSLLVNAPWTLIEMLEHLNPAPGTPGHRRIVELDVGEPEQIFGRKDDVGTVLTPAFQVRQADIIRLVGLELVLADADRRKAALEAVEWLVSRVDAMAFTPDLSTPSEVRQAALLNPHILFLVPVAPMDRILDAYEREAASAATADPGRENLRWAKLFEDFATFQFRPTLVTDGEAPPLQPTEGISPDARRAEETVFAELKWLSPRVVNGCINDEVSVGRALLSQAVLPLTRPGTADESPYPALYRQRILKWARARQFPGPEAALAYMKGQLIEHYQRLWSASTRAEKMVLHHLAHGRFVNIANAVAFGSLVRRGLVVLDPEPRIMNRSFAMFVRQAEKLDAIRDLRKGLPEGAWIKARLPLLGGIVLALALLAVLLALGEEPVKFLVPVLAAGGPVLAASLWRTVRGG